MKNTENICAGILGSAFLVFGFNFFFQFFSMPAPPADSLVIPFFQATGQSGFMTFVKITEIVSSSLVDIGWGQGRGLARFLKDKTCECIADRTHVYFNAGELHVFALTYVHKTYYFLIEADAQ